eukprot:scpid102091/ scgid30031/ 
MFLKSRRSLSFHFSRRRHTGGASKRGRIRSNSAQGLLRLFKLLSSYLIGASTYVIVILSYQIPAFINVVQHRGDLEMDKDGTRTHSQCLMTSRPSTADCAHIQQRNISIEMTFHICVALLCLFFSTWAYRREYWKDAWPFSTRRPLQLPL